MNKLFLSSIGCLIFAAGLWADPNPSTPPIVPVVGETNNPVTFTAKDGRKFENAKVTVTDTGLSVLTPNGGASIAFDQLPDDLSIFSDSIRKQITEKRQTSSMQSSLVLPSPNQPTQNVPKASDKTTLLSNHLDVEVTSPRLKAKKVEYERSVQGWIIQYQEEFQRYQKLEKAVNDMTLSQAARKDKAEAAEREHQVLLGLERLIQKTKADFTLQLQQAVAKEQNQAENMAKLQTSANTGATSNSSCARLGETEDEIVNRHSVSGAQVRHSFARDKSGNVTSIKVDIIEFTYSGFDVRVTCLNGISCAEDFQKNRSNITVDETGILLSANAEGHGWKMTGTYGTVGATPTVEFNERSDGNVLREGAQWLRSDGAEASLNSNTLHFQRKELTDATTALLKDPQHPKMEGF